MSVDHGWQGGNDQPLFITLHLRLSASDTTTWVCYLSVLNTYSPGSCQLEALYGHNARAKIAVRFKYADMNSVQLTGLSNTPTTHWQNLKLMPDSRANHFGSSMPEQGVDLTICHELLTSPLSARSEGSFLPCQGWSVSQDTSGLSHSNSLRSLSHRLLYCVCASCCALSHCVLMLIL